MKTFIKLLKLFFGRSTIEILEADLDKEMKKLSPDWQKINILRSEIERIVKG
jgi:hypothetical protein